MAEAFDYHDIFSLTHEPGDPSCRSLDPGPEWNTFLAANRTNEENLAALGAVVAVTAGVGIHAGMIEFSAEAFASAAQPPLTGAERSAFMNGAMSQQAVMNNLDRARGGNL